MEKFPGPRFLSVYTQTSRILGWVLPVLVLPKDFEVGNPGEGGGLERYQCRRRRTQFVTGKTWREHLPSHLSRLLPFRIPGHTGPYSVEDPGPVGPYGSPTWSPRDSVRRLSDGRFQGSRSRSCARQGVRRPDSLPPVCSTLSLGSRWD